MAFNDGHAGYVRVEPKVGDGENNLITQDYAVIFYPVNPDE